MRIVGIDTATAVASVALIENGQLIVERTDPCQQPAPHVTGCGPKANHAEVILPLLAGVIDAAEIALGDVDGLAVSIGPGSFTGLRIGLSTVKGVAYGGSIPVVGVPTLLATAARAVHYEGLICPLLDARKRQVYAALFHKKGDTLTCLMEDAVACVETVLERISGFDAHASYWFIGDGAKVYESLLADRFGSRARFSGDQLSSTVAAAAARLSERRFQHNDTDDLASLVPVYIRPPEAELNRAVIGVTD
jgi:tRNA threonylcarbamoyladenosine biosynthesis protein TsaB